MGRDTTHQTLGKLSGYEMEGIPSPPPTIASLAAAAARAEFNSAARALAANVVPLNMLQSVAFLLMVCLQEYPKQSNHQLQMQAFEGPGQ